MLIVSILRWLLLAVNIVVACQVLYLVVVSLSAMLSARRRSRAPVQSVQPHDFAILIPAHDEEYMLGGLLGSLNELNYPADHYVVCVVADNCTDGTARLARQFTGVRVYERADTTKRGKGYALNWLIKRVDADRLLYDACVIIDADSVVPPDFLQALNRELAQGARALQARNTVLNTQESPSTIVRWIALELVNHVRTLGRNGLGASATLTGNGMCLSRSLLREYPWQAFSVTEDYQYYLTLILHGEKVRYVPEAVVRSHMPTTFAQMRTQDIRWEASDPSQSHWRMACELFLAGLRARDVKRLEAVIELLTPPLSSLVSICGCLLLASLCLWSWPLLLFACAITLGLSLYIGTAFYFLRPARSVYKALFYTPAFIVWKLWVYIVLRRSKKHAGEWVRTERTTVSE